MPLVNTLQRTVNFASQSIRLAPLAVTFGAFIEPAFTIGDWVRQFILGPPFAWRWNRATLTFTTTAGTQDYQQKNIPANAAFGWLEKATWNDGGTPATVREIEVALNLGEETVQNAPVSV